MEKISQTLKEHYEAAFESHGNSSMGVDWGAEEKNLHLRYEKMLAVLGNSNLPSPKVLDVGCGFGGLLSYAESRGVNISYSGIDVAENMIKWAGKELGKGRFFQGDFLEFEFTERYDYVVCNGILTQKLNVEGLAMDVYAQRLIKRMYDLCLEGIAFNVMTTKVNYFANNLYYRNPAELLSWCLSEITRHVKIDHAYPLFEYTVYLYRNVEK